jgi:hypothetical protein
VYVWVLLDGIAQQNVVMSCAGTAFTLTGSYYTIPTCSGAITIYNAGSTITYYTGTSVAATAY